MARTALDLDSYADPPAGWATSLTNLAEVLIPCLEATGTRSVGEVGAYAGDLTRLLVDWAAQVDGRVVAIDPSPQDALVGLARERPELELVHETSLAALPHIELPGTLIIDGDHNYWTVTQELAIVAERAPGAELPLLLFHDVCWPHARRDDYHAAELIPEESRHPVAGDDQTRGLYPGDSGLRAGGLPYPRSAAREGGDRNGVRTAVEDFVAEHEGLQLAVVPAFFGLGVLWHQGAPWADRVAEIVDPWDRNSLFARLEAGRVRHLADLHAQAAEIWAIRDRLSRQEALLRRLLDSSAFGVAERLSRLRDRAGVASEQSVISKEEIRRALED